MSRNSRSRGLGGTSSSSAMDSLIESIDHRLDGSMPLKTIKTEVDDDYDQITASIYAAGGDPNAEYPMMYPKVDNGYDNSGMFDDLDLSQSSGIQGPSGTINLERLLNGNSMSDEDGDVDWSKFNFMKSMRKQDSIHDMSDQCLEQYTDELFLFNDSANEVLSMIYADIPRGLLKNSYRLWVLHRLGIDPLKEVSCRLNWSEVVPGCLQECTSEDGRVKNALRKYISNYIYNCRQTIVVRENRDELNRIKTLGWNKERLRKAISQMVNKTSDKHGWTLYRPIPSYIMRNISAVRNRQSKETFEDSMNMDAIPNTESDNNDGDTVEDSINSVADIHSMGSLGAVLKHVFVRGTTSPLRDTYRDEAIRALGIKDWLRVDPAMIDYSPALPEVIKEDPLLTKRVQTRIAAWAVVCVRKARIKVLIEKYAKHMLKIRDQYSKEAVPEGKLQSLLDLAAKENNWEGSIPSANGIKGWIYERSVEYFKNRAIPGAKFFGDAELEDVENNEKSRESERASSNETPPSAESRSYKAALREVFDSRGRLKPEFVKSAYDSMGIDAYMKGDPSTIDFSPAVPAAIRQQPAMLMRVNKRLTSRAASMVLKRRKTIVMHKKAAQMANFRRQYPTSKDVPRDIVQDVIDQAYQEEGWGEHRPGVEAVISTLYELTMAHVERMSESNVDDIVESEEASCSKSVNGSVLEEDNISEVSSATPADSASLRRSNRNLRKRSMDDSDAVTPVEPKKKPAPVTPKQIDDQFLEVEEEESCDTSDASLQLALKATFERDVKGPLSANFRKRVVDELGITMPFPGILEELDYSNLIPLAIQKNREAHDQVKQAIIIYLTGFIRRTRLTYIAEHKAPELMELLNQYPKQNSMPLNTLYAFINKVSKEKGWKRYLPLASKLKYRIYERRELIAKRALRLIQQRNQDRIPPASATAIVATGSAVTPLQTGSKNKRPSLSSLLAVGGKNIFSTPDGDGSQAVSSTTLVASGSGRGVDCGTSGSFVNSMKNKLKDMNPEEMSALMNRINKHVRDKIVAQLTSQIVQNFDPNQQDNMFSEILGMVDAHKTP